MDAYSQGGWIGPSGPVMVQIHPDECVIAPDGDGLWRCRRASHVARACGTHSQASPDHWPYQPEG